MKTALQLLDLVWCTNSTTAWEALNHCMADAVKLAIGAKLEWEPSDFAYIQKKYRPWKWLSEHGWERFYSLAVWTDGTSFIKAYESAIGRKPFLANDVSSMMAAEGYTHANSQTRKRGRITLRSEVRIAGIRYECTSINNERIVLTSWAEKRRTIKKLTPEDCAELWPAPKKKVKEVIT